MSQIRRLVITTSITMLSVTLVLVVRSLFKSADFLQRSSFDVVLTCKFALLAVPVALAKSAPASLLLGSVFSARPTAIEGNTPDSKDALRNRYVTVSFLAMTFAIFCGLVLFWVAPESERAQQSLVAPGVAGDSSDLVQNQTLSRGRRSATLVELFEILSGNPSEDQRRLVINEIAARASWPLSCILFAAMAGLEFPWRTKIYVSICTIVGYYLVAGVGARALDGLYGVLVVPNVLLLALILVLLRRSGFF